MISKHSLVSVTHTDIFFGQSPKTMEIKTNINKWDLINCTSFCTAKETINKNENTTYRMEEKMIQD